MAHCDSLLLVASQVYRVLEQECQQELQKCKDGKGAAPPPDAPQELAQALAAAAAPPCPPCAGGELHGELYVMDHARRLLLAAAVGAVVGWLAHARLCGGRRWPRGGSAHVEEMRGWMPLANDMKLS